MIRNLIKSRRAVFPVQYNTELITAQEINEILELANWAPTHRRTEPWRFKVFHTEASRKKLSEFLGETYERTIEKYSEVKHRKVMEKPIQSGCVIAICMQRGPDKSVPEWEEIASTAMAVQNMWLGAREIGIGAYWSSPALKDHLHHHIPLASGERCLGFFYMGKFDGELPEGMRKSTIDDKTKWY